MSKIEDTARTFLLELAAQRIAGPTNTHGMLAIRMAEHFPWMLALVPDDQVACVDAILASTQASFATHRAHLIDAEITVWRETASAFAADLGNTRVEWIEDTQSVGPG